MILKKPALALPSHFLCYHISSSLLFQGLSQILNDIVCIFDPNA